MTKPKRNPKTATANEQTPDGGGNYAGESRGGFDPLMGWNTAIGVGAAGVVYAKTRTPRTKIPNIRAKSWTAEEESNYYATQAASLEREVRKMDHPSYYGTASRMNQQDKLFTKIEQVRMMNQADRLRSRANWLAARGKFQKK